MLSASHVAESLRDSEEPQLGCSFAAVSASERLTYVEAFSEKCQKLAPTASLHFHCEFSHWHMLRALMDSRL